MGRNKKERCDACDKIARHVCPDCGTLFCDKDAEIIDFECDNHDLNLQPYL